MAASNVRECRRLAKEQELRRAQARTKQLGLGSKPSLSTELAWADRQRKDRELAARLCAKHFRDGSDPTRLEIPNPIVLLYDYWMARACGWDVLTGEYARDKDWKPCSPSESWSWVWWSGLHYKQRRQIRGDIKAVYRAARKAS